MHFLDIAVISMCYEILNRVYPRNHGYYPRIPLCKTWENRRDFSYVYVINYPKVRWDR